MMNNLIKNMNKEKKNQQNKINRASFANSEFPITKRITEPNTLVLFEEMDKETLKKYPMRIQIFSFLIIMCT